MSAVDRVVRDIRDWVCIWCMCKLNYKAIAYDVRKITDTAIQLSKHGTEFMYVFSLRHSTFLLLLYGFLYAS